MGYRDLRWRTKPRRRKRRGGTPGGGHGRLALLLGLVAVCVLALARHLENRGVRGTLPISDYIEEESLAQEIQGILDEAGGTYGVYVRIVQTGEEVGIRCRDEFFAASCYKLPLVLMLYEEAQAGEIDLSEKVAYSPEDRETGTGIVIGYKYGSQFSLRELANLAVVKSDNVAANMLLRHLGKERFIEYQKRVGASVIPENVNHSSPADMGLFAERLLEFASRHAALGRELLDYFLQAEFKDRIPAMLPDTVKVANKIGTWPGTVNDVGIVMYGEVEYVLAVMSRDVPSTEGAANTIAMISSKIYDHIRTRATIAERGAAERG